MKQNLESTLQNPEFWSWNPKSKELIDYLTWVDAGSLQTQRKNDQAVSFELLQKAAKNYLAR